MVWWRTPPARAFQLVLVWFAQLLVPHTAWAGDGGMDLLSAETLTISGADDEDGWALTLAMRRSLGRSVTGLVEYLHVESDKPARNRAGIAACQPQNQLQPSLQLKW